MLKQSICVVALTAAVCVYDVTASPAGGPSAAVLAAVEIGITAESLVGCGMATGQCSTASTLLGRIEAATQLRQDLRDAREAVDAAGQALSLLAGQIALRPDDEQLISDYDNAAAQLQTARQLVQSLQQDLRDIALDGMGTESVAQLTQWQENASLSIPAEFRAVARSDEQWKEITRALRAERRANRLGQQLDSEHAAVLAAIRGDLEVVAAKYELETHVDAVRTVFHQHGAE